jgi:LacI family repressor for deo operon, udp, cdd, tsx, nupC, and nupG
MAKLPLDSELKILYYHVTGHETGNMEPNMSQERLTIRDVARHAGVSHQTVSRVINDSENVLPETRAKVEAAIAELGYRPNAIAQSMARGRSNMLACIAPNLTDFTFASIIEKAEVEARQNGYFLFSSSAEDVDSFVALLDELISYRRIEGLIVINPYADERYQHIPDNFPTVLVGVQSHRKEICSVSLDDEKLAYEATNHLISLGHKKIAMISGPMKEDCSRDRTRGYERALKEAALPLDKAMVIEGDWSASSGRDGLLHLKMNGTIPSAVFAQNDRMALGVLHACRDLGLKVPEQMAVIGVDDMPLASYFDPPLTTMKQDMPRIGQEAIKLLLQTISKTPVKRRQVKFPAQLVIRQSTIKRTEEVSS